MKRISYSELKNYKRSMSEIGQKYLDVASEIIENVRSRGDDAIIEYSIKFDNVRKPDYSIIVTEDEMDEALKITRERFGDVFRYFLNAADNIREFHERQKERGWSFGKNGCLLGQKISPIDRVGLYVPGGMAFYPSTIMMNVIPAKIAGVPELFIATPPGPDGRIKDPLAIALAAELGVTSIFKAGGAQAIAAMAYGTQSIPPVSKIMGPGNLYVAAAKLLVMRHVGIDTIAGPSEIVIFADETANPEWIAADLCAQAEHTGDNMVILISDSERVIMDTEKVLLHIIPAFKRRKFIEKSINENAFAVLVDNYEEGFDMINRLSPEHVEVDINLDRDEIIERIKNAGALFIGNWTPVAAGDYYAGPNHVIPTNGSAAFSSPLGVYDFVKRTSIMSLSGGYINENGKAIASMAEFEKLDAHALSIRIRMSGSGSKS
jgi:histidinol dehydrogenase